jgi:coenzyme F420-reducing hydrogenase alpha subunit
MKVDLNVDVRHLARVEGHGNIKVVVKEGKLEEASWQVVETPRYFEVMLKGKHYTTAPILTARICGICSIGHCLASLRATERVFGITIPEAAAKLRLLAKHGETLQSHYLHLFFLALPDLVGRASVLPLLEVSPESVQVALGLKGLANRLCDLVAGRTTHPVSLQVGGVARMPSKEELLSLRDGLRDSLESLESTVNLFRTIELPSFVRETEFVSLQGSGEYPFIGGRMVSTDGVVHEEDEYQAMTNEYVDENNTSKLCRLSRRSFAVGALARFNNNHAALHADALSVASALGLKPVCHNPFMNNVAQLVECVHVTHDSIRLLDELVEAGSPETMTPVSPRAGEGVGAVEVPRGILYHHYEYGDDGRVRRANCVIPTTQNNANIHHDIPALVEQFAAQQGMSDEQLERLCSMLVRAYDPCISCSVH